MNETEYRVFRDGTFFAKCDNRKNADLIMEWISGMLTPPQPAQHEQEGV